MLIYLAVYSFLKKMFSPPFIPRLTIMPFTCPICNLICRKKQTSIKCSICHNWIHHNTKNQCSLLTNEELELPNLSNKTWVCPICVSSSLPFGQLDENQWLLFNLDKNDLVSDDINLVPNAA